MPPREISQRSQSKNRKASSPKPADSPVAAKKSPLGKSSDAKPQPSRHNALGASGAYISHRAADRLRAGHVWVYRSDIEKLVVPSEDARLLPVHDSRGLFLGTALYSANSQIALRMISPNRLDQHGWLALFRERLHAAIQFRKTGASAGDEDTNAGRLVFSEADFLPGLIADKYGDLVVLQIQTHGMDTSEIRQTVLDTLIAEINPRAVFERSDPRIVELEQLTPPPDSALYCKPGASSQASTIFELNGLRFHYDANSGQKTGAFLDQRENYSAAARHSRGEALDVCTYHGGFALHLARVCSHVTGVDASRPALEVAEQNLALNRENLGSIEVDWVEANAFDLLRDWSDTGRKFDSIVLDPPAFAKSKKAAEGALRGYKELNLRALKMLRPGGTLVTCSCSHHVSLEDFTAVITAAGVDSKRQVRLLERRGAALDHPVLLTVPETEYLKCLICRVD